MMFVMVEIALQLFLLGVEVAHDGDRSELLRAGFPCVLM